MNAALLALSAFASGLLLGLVLCRWWRGRRADDMREIKREMWP